MTLTVGSLFSGIGGLDLGLERAGMQVIWQSEIDPYCCKVLKKHWPKVVNHGDIKNIEWGNVKRPDIICGGYPCQPFSTAGKRRGADDPRHLWPVMFNAICNLRPRYALLENVRGHLSVGFGTVLADLASVGFNAEWQIIPAAAIGAPHKRDRLFVVAYPNSKRLERPRAKQQTTRVVRGSKNVANTPSVSSNEREPRQCACEIKAPWKVGVKIRGERGIMANTQSSARGESQSHGLRTVFGQTAEFGKSFGSGRPSNDWWETEPNVGRVANGVPNRVDRLRGLGNAVVPQVAEFVGRLIINNLE